MEPRPNEDDHGTNPYQSPRQPAFADANRAVRQQSNRRVGPLAFLYLFGSAMLVFLIARLAIINLDRDSKITEFDKFATVLTAITGTLTVVSSFIATPAWWRKRWLRGLLVCAVWLAFWTLFLLLQLGVFAL
jgi:hypothetical protein